MRDVIDEEFCSGVVWISLSCRYLTADGKTEACHNYEDRVFLAMACGLDTPEEVREVLKCLNIHQPDLDWEKRSDAYVLRLRRTPLEGRYAPKQAPDSGIGSLDHFDNYRVAQILGGMRLIDYSHVCDRRGMLIVP